MVKQRNFRYLTFLFAILMMTGAAVSCSSSEPEEQNFRITVRDGEPSGGVQTFEAKQGDTVLIRYGTNVTGNFHIHGYDIETEVVAGRERVEIFLAETTGRFEIELEELEETVAWLEVQPR